MCIIIANRKGLLDERTVVQSYINNSHGAGIAYVEDGKVHVYKELNGKGKTTKEDAELFYQRYKGIREKNDLPIMLHFRIVSKGGLSLDNTHPFYVETGKLAFAHNGTIRDVPTSGDQSDTVALNERYLKNLYRSNPEFLKDENMTKFLEEYVGKSRIAFLDASGEITILNKNALNGHSIGDNWFSNYSYNRGTFDRGGITSTSRGGASSGYDNRDYYGAEMDGYYDHEYDYLGNHIQNKYSTGAKTTVVTSESSLSSKEESFPFAAADPKNYFDLAPRSYLDFIRDFNLLVKYKYPYSNLYSGTANVVTNIHAYERYLKDTPNSEEEMDICQTVGMCDSYGDVAKVKHSLQKKFDKLAWNKNLAAVSNKDKLTFFEWCVFCMPNLQVLAINKGEHTLPIKMLNNELNCTYNYGRYSYKDYLSMCLSAGIVLSPHDYFLLFPLRSLAHYLMYREKELTPLAKIVSGASGYRFDTLSSVEYTSYMRRMADMYGVENNLMFLDKDWKVYGFNARKNRDFAEYSYYLNSNKKNNLTVPQQELGISERSKYLTKIALANLSIFFRNTYEVTGETELLKWSSNATSPVSEIGKAIIRCMMDPYNIPDEDLILLRSVNRFSMAEERRKVNKFLDSFLVQKNSITKGNKPIITVALEDTITKDLSLKIRPITIPSLILQCGNKDLLSRYVKIARKQAIDAINKSVKYISSPFNRTKNGEFISMHITRTFRFKIQTLLKYVLLKEQSPYDILEKQSYNSLLEILIDDKVYEDYKRCFVSTLFIRETMRKFVTKPEQPILKKEFDTLKYCVRRCQLVQAVNSNYLKVTSHDEYRKVKLSERYTRNIMDQTDPINHNREAITYNKKNKNKNAFLGRFKYVVDTITSGKALSMQEFLDFKSDCRINNLHNKPINASKLGLTLLEFEKIVSLSEKTYLNYLREYTFDVQDYIENKIPETIDLSHLELILGVIASKKDGNTQLVANYIDTFVTEKNLTESEAEPFYKLYFEN